MTDTLEVAKRFREMQSRPKIHEDTLTVFTDGSSFSQPRRGGVGIVYVMIDPSTGNEIVDETSPAGYQAATNNQMELMACIMALEAAPEHPFAPQVSNVVIYTDSRYVAGNIDRALFTWPKGKWCNPNGRPIENAELWRRLIKAYRAFPRHLRVEVKWAKGHSSQNPYNKKADKLARNSSGVPVNQPIYPREVRRKISREMTVMGSVGMHGQEMAIRIIEERNYQLAKRYGYRYEVLSPESKYFGKIDVIFANYDCTHMRAGHHYQVLVNSDNRNPSVRGVICELERKDSAQDEAIERPISTDEESTY